MFHTARDGSILWVNDAAARIVGYESAKQFVATVDDIRTIYVDPGRRDAFVAALEGDGAVSDFEYEIWRPDGSTRWISVTATSLRDDEGQNAYEGIVIDITSRKLMEAAEEAISARLEPTEAVARFGEVLRRVIPYQQLTLTIVDEGRYQRIVSLTTEAGREPLPTGQWVLLEDNSMGEVVRTSQPVVVQDTANSPWGFDARLRTAGIGSYAIFPLIDAGQVFATFNLGLATTNAFDEERVDLLAHHTSAVSHTVKNILLFEQQRDAVQRLEELHRMKNEFFAEVSHDLRHPLAVVSGMTSMLRNDWERLDDDRKREFLDVIVRNVGSLHDLMERDLAIALIEAGDLSYDIVPFDLLATAREVVDSFAKTSPDRSVTVSAEGEIPTALGDPRRHSQILQNLVSNALKFSPAGSPVAVTLHAATDEIFVSVADTGPGIPEDQRAHLFERLHRLDPSKPGTGLGLYVARSMVEGQSGRIWLDTETAAGARFTYTAPRAPA